MAKCVVCQQVKIKHQKHVGGLQPLLIPEWKWEDITMDLWWDYRRVRQGITQCEWL
jgi:hypothetical protein